MQILPRYLVNNQITIIANEAGLITEYRPMYQRNIQVYRNIDNVLQFRLLNSDQKPLDVSVYTPKFVAFDENNTLIIEHNGVVLPGDDSSPTRGLFSVTVTENDLLNIKQQFLSYNVYLVDADNNKVLTYTDTQFSNAGVIYVNSEAFPGPSPTYSVTQFQQYNFSSEEYISESLSAEPAINGNEALHTAAVYTSSYIGNIIVQATLENSVTESTAWADVQTVAFSGAETQPTPINFNGVFNHLRFKTDANPTDKISKILVRN
tara:strand:+ start:543 stop:1331 length:789 start_codon:yes stop_codon:yes gene_type:complete